MSGTDDHALAALIGRIARREGGERALGALIEALGPPVTRIAARFLGSAAEADEVAQDTFLRVWDHAARFDPARGGGRAWVFAIAVRLCHDRARRARVRAVLGLGRGTEGVAEPADPAPGPAEVLAARQEVAATAAALRALPGRQRMAILLTVAGGMDSAAAAATLGVGPGALEQLLVRARRGLRARLERD